MFAALAIFIVKYSKVDVVKHELSGNNFQSNMDRAEDQRCILAANGDQILILTLQGFIFFGTANALADRIRYHLKRATHMPLRFLLLDFRQVTGLDTSALSSLEKIRQLERINHFTLVFTSLPLQLHRQLEQGVPGGQERDVLHAFPDLDLGMEWCENEILAAELSKYELDGLEAGPKSPLPVSSEILTACPKGRATFESIVRRLSPYMERQELPENSYLIRQGSPPAAIYFIDSGQVTTQLELGGGGHLRLRIMGAGTVVGEMSCYLRKHTSASVITDSRCVVYCLSLENLARIQNGDSALAAAFHEFIANLMCERVGKLTRSVEALMNQ